MRIYANRLDKVTCCRLRKISCHPQLDLRYYEKQICPTSRVENPSLTNARDFCVAAKTTEYSLRMAALSVPVAMVLVPPLRCWWCIPLLYIAAVAVILFIQQKQTNRVLRGFRIPPAVPLLGHIYLFATSRSQFTSVLIISLAGNNCHSHTARKDRIMLYPTVVYTQDSSHSSSQESLAMLSRSVGLVLVEGWDDLVNFVPISQLRSSGFGFWVSYSYPQQCFLVLRKFFVI